MRDLPRTAPPGYPARVNQNSIAQAFERGLEHHRAGRLAQAEAAYRQILETVPGHPDALQLLAVIAHQAGRNDAALELIDGAIAARPLHPEYRGQRGRVLYALGRLDEAVASYRAALGLAPEHAGALCGLGNALKLQGRLAESVDCYRRALALRPDFVEAQANLGNALYVLGHADAALACYARAIARVETPELRAAFAECLRGATFDGADGDAGSGNLADIRRFAIRALSEPWMRPADLAPACIRLILQDPAIGACVARASRAWPQRLPGAVLFGTAGLAAVSGDRLLRTLLENAQACDLALERFLTTARLAMLDAVEDDAGGAAQRDGAAADAGTEAAADELAFRCALASQCHINDYVFATTDAESGRAGMLRDRLLQRLQRGATSRRPRSRWSQRISRWPRCPGSRRCSPGRGPQPSLRSSPGRSPSRGRSEGCASACRG